SALPARARERGAGESAGEGGQDRPAGDRPRSLRDLPNGGGRRAVPAVRPHPGADRKATSARPRPTLTLEGGNARQPGVEPRPECVLRLPQSGRTALGDVREPRGGRPGRALAPEKAENLAFEATRAYPGTKTRMGPVPSGKCRLMME